MMWPPCCGSGTFGRNKIRMNVFPEGATSVHSDTLGLVRSRDGRVVVSRMTTKNSDVFRLLCKWIRDQLPALYSMPFVFTGISVNFGYAARKHRDGNNVGPSMTKSFGNFAGGGLKYWPNDDGLCNLDQLRERNAMHVDTKRSMLLFDGHRCHSVAPFSGERYSLVFFHDYRPPQGWPSGGGVSGGCGGCMANAGCLALLDTSRLTSAGRVAEHPHDVWIRGEATGHSVRRHTSLPVGRCRRPSTGLPRNAAGNADPMCGCTIYVLCVLAARGVAGCTRGHALRAPMWPQRASPLAKVEWGACCHLGCVGVHQHWSSRINHDHSLEVASTRDGWRAVGCRFAWPNTAVYHCVHRAVVWSCSPLLCKHQ